MDGAQKIFRVVTVARKKVILTALLVLFGLAFFPLTSDKIMPLFNKSIGGYVTIGGILAILAFIFAGLVYTRNT